MASANNDRVFKDGGSSNKPPLFSGQYLEFWKIRMKAHLEAQGSDIWEAVQNGPFIPTTVVNGASSTMPQGSWDDDDKKRVLYDKKAINILQSALGMDEFFRVSTCTMTKEIWDTLVETHEGMTEVKRSRLNTLSQEYELFRMQPGESILDLQKRFVHLTNHLKALGKTLTNDELNLKVLRSLTREWQPIVTTISEKKSLSTMTSATLFGKLQEYETELGLLEKHEVQEKKSKSIALKVDSKVVKKEDNPEEDENFMLLVKRLGKYFGAKSSSSDSDSDQSVNLALMASHHSDDEDDEVSSNFSIFDNDAQGEIDELLSECKILYKTISSQKNQISTLEENIEKMKNNLKDEKEELIKNFACTKCESLDFQIVQLKSVIERYEKGQIGLEHVLSSQRYSNDKRGLGYSNFDKQTSNKTIFVKAKEQIPLDKSNKPKVVHQYNNRKRNKSYYKKKSYSPRYKSNFEPTCFYCGIKGHTPNACYVRNFSVAQGHYVWVKKGTNFEGPKSIWVPNKT
ncbi:uncharacterized protein LOC127082659 [Lathyrus oleraceus]|uniref:uncharacterized protein LOC127082659 n=1 Tax=Pisum sativum TaxID=3888 RepID=UPI0021CDFD14|nr:uncharacterized protein LOC127082659 [Pisum sativum]